MVKINIKQCIEDEMNLYIRKRIRFLARNFGFDDTFKVKKAEIKNFSKEIAKNFIEEDIFHQFAVTMIGTPIYTLLLPNVELDFNNFDSQNATKEELDFLDAKINEKLSIKNLSSIFTKIS